MSDPLLDHFRTQWKFLRGLTYDLLLHLSDRELLAEPGDGLGPWWKQFRHVGRVQENYLNALSTGTLEFTTNGCTYAGSASAVALSHYLQGLDIRMAGMITDGLPERPVRWFGESRPPVRHLLCLADHELLHHGQWIIYRKLLGGSFPESWSAWGLWR